MKFYVDTKKKGEEAKSRIKEITVGNGYISLKRVWDIIGSGPMETIYPSENRGWSFSDIRKKMRLRETKNGWFLYFPELTELPFGPVKNTQKIIPELRYTKELGEKLEKELGVRCCRIVHKKNGKIIEQFGFCHGIFQSSRPNKDGQLIQQALWAVELVDGTTCDVTSGHIIFGWED